MQVRQRRPRRLVQARPALRLRLPGAHFGAAARRHLDLQIEVPALSAADLVLPAPSEGSAEVRARVSRARDLQRRRFTALGARTMRTNADCSGRVLEEIATPDAEGVALLRQAADTLHLSARGFHRTLRVARTLADLDGTEKIGRMHVAEALSYRGETLRQARAA